MKKRRFILQAPLTIKLLLLAVCGLGIVSLGTHVCLAFTNTTLFAQWDALLTGLRRVSSIVVLVLLVYAVIRHGRLVDSGPTSPSGGSEPPRASRH